jgi:hypothetical protein
LLSSSDLAPYVANHQPDDLGTISSTYLANEGTGPPLKNYIALTRSAIPTLTAEDRLYNRYFWFCRLVNASRAVFGEDAGLEQQAFQILENADCDVDWEMTRQIELLASSP